ncbi:Hint domain-containing protein [Lentibacter sp. XHP0401]|uniref:Hint domain-containing protein n=1 Tax=Lentibacter sp. XHP0401 TaxID=2984334 RepID=UPI0021E8E020|nr:Hint domain-containing protein [Lentibacter sp. XHP0401]MCV2893760.1 Hint domain-containing protein [Lentibacter sp. XHP0401]
MPTANELNLNTNATAMDMAEAMFGDGVTITNATYTGAASASGTYTGGLSTLGSLTQSDTGVILSTGNAADFTNSSGTSDTNVSDGTSTDHTGAGGIVGDTDLNAVSGQDTFDGAFFEAEFVAAGDLLTMQFVFTSEEYLEYVNGGVNDAMGVWVNGTYIPLTLADGSTQNVTIDTINDGTNSNLYVDNPSALDTYNTEMDGGTVVLSLTAPVNAGESNTIRIGIGDGGDSSYDSNLLIMGNSIQTVSIAERDELVQGANVTQSHDLLSNDINIDNNQLTITHINNVAVNVGDTVTLPSGEQITLNADMTVDILTDGDIGTNNFTYSTIDSAGNVSTGLATIETSANPPDFIVEGTTGADVIDVAYTGDPEGDMIDNTDHSDASNADYVEAGAGNDSVVSGAGNDTVFGADGSDTIFGGDGDDNLDGDDAFATGAADYIDGGAGNDQIIGDVGNDSLYGGTGRDTIYAGDDDDLVYGGAGDDSLYGEAGNDYISGGDGNDNIVAGDGSDNVDGGNGNDTVFGDAGGDNIDGDAGDDMLYGGTGSDSIWGGTGNDTIDGGSEADALYGGAGDDSILGGAGGDFISLSGGADIVNAGDDADNIVVDATNYADGTTVTVDGGTGGVDNDTLNLSDFTYYTALSETPDADGDSTSGSVTVQDASGNLITFNFTEIESLILPPPAPNYIVEGTGGDDTIDAAYAGDPEGDMIDANDHSDGSNDDSVTAGDGDDSVVAGAGNDTVWGDGGNDTIQGGTGDDSIMGDGGTGTGAPATLDWTNVPLTNGDGVATVSDGTDTVGVTVTGSGLINTGYGVDEYYRPTNVQITEANSTLIEFDGAVENVSFELFDVDSNGTTFDDQFTIIALDADGNEVPVTFTGVTHHTVTGNTIEGEADLDSGHTGTQDAVTVNIPFEVVSIEIIYEPGSDVGNTGLAGIGDLNFEIVPSGDDSLDGGAGNDTINGMTGDDVVVGGTGDDSLDGGAGQDTLYGGDDQDSIHGGLGNDVISGDAGDDTARGGIGNDTIDGGDGNDSMYGNEGDDSITGDAGNDSIYGEFGNDYVAGGDGDDHIEGNEGDDTLVGGAGDDWVRGSYGNDELHGGEGDDFLWGGYGDDTLIFADNFGNDTVEGEEAFETDGDTIDLSGVTSDLTIDLTSANPENGTFTNGTGTVNFVEIENIILGGGADTLVLGTGSGQDRVEGFSIPTESGGVYTGVDLLDVSTLVDTNGAPVNTDDVTLSTDANGDAVLTFPSGESLTLVGVTEASITDPDVLEAMGIPQPNYIVEGTAGGDLIDGGYIADPEGDVIDGLDNAAGTNDDSVVAGAGDDTVFSYAGNDTIDGGAGNDSLDGGDGDDTLAGDTGNDTLQGWFGDDALEGGAGDDSLIGWTGDDTIAGGTGADSIEGGDDQDLIILEDGFGNDTIDGGDGGVTDYDTLDMSAVTTDTTVDLTSANPENGSVTSGGDTATFIDIENIVLGAGTDTVVLADGSGSDTVDGFEAPTDLGGGNFTGNDQLDVSGMTDADGNPVNVLDVTVTDTNGDGTGDAILSFPNGESITLTGVLPSEVDSYGALEALGIPGTDEIVSGTAAGDLIDGSYTGDPDGDMVDAGDNLAQNNDDSIEAGAGDDTVLAGAGNDSVIGDAGNDSLAGGGGDDLISGGTGNDTLDGGAGADSLLGGAGDDMLTVGENDTAEGGDGDDHFTIDPTGETGTGSISIIGGEGDETLGDTLDFEGQIHWGDITYTNTDPGVGGGLTGFATLGDGTVVNFTEIENIIICFTEGTRIATPRGARDVAALEIGDLVVTRDHGLQPIRWIGKRTVPARGSLAPIRFEANVIGNERALYVSPQHRMLMQGPEASLLFGESEVLVSAKHLVNGSTVTEAQGGDVTYVHIMFDEHEIIYAEGAASESFFPGGTGLNAVEEEAREELFSLFPELRSHDGAYGDTARLCLKAHESRLLRLG